MKLRLIFTFLLTAIIFTISSFAQEKPIPSSTSVPDEEKIFEKVDIEASVDLALWRKHLEANLISYLEEAARKKMKAGTYTVNVRFLVERDGRISNVVALNDPGYNLALGAVRVVRTGPKWTPGELTGKKVRSYHIQPITFQIQER